MNIHTKLNDTSNIVNCVHLRVSGKTRKNVDIHFSVQNTKDFLGGLKMVSKKRPRVVVFPVDCMKGKAKKQYINQGKVVTYNMYEDITKLPQLSEIRKMERPIMMGVIQQARENFSKATLTKHWKISGGEFYTMLEELGLRDKQGGRKKSLPIEKTTPTLRELNNLSLEERKNSIIELRKKHSNGQLMRHWNIKSSYSFYKMLNDLGIHEVEKDVSKRSGRKSIKNETQQLELKEVAITENENEIKNSIDKSIDDDDNMIIDKLGSNYEQNIEHEIDIKNETGNMFNMYISGEMTMLELTQKINLLTMMLGNEKIKVDFKIMK